MWLDDFFQQSGQEFSFTRAQASRFAKHIADDFNPIHDIDAKRFCVPGDLLFALTLAHSGLAQTMDFSFADMVQDGVNLRFDEDADEVRVAIPQARHGDRDLGSLHARGRRCLRPPVGESDPLLVENDRIVHTEDYDGWPEGRSSPRAS